MAERSTSSSLIRTLLVTLGALLALPFGLLLQCGAVWILVLSVVNHPALNEPAPALETVNIRDEANRTSYGEFIAASHSWDEKLGERFFVPMTWHNMPHPLPADVAADLDRTAALRDTVFTFLLERNLDPFIASVNDTFPRIFTIISVFKLEAIEAISLGHSGRQTEATAKLERMYRAANRLGRRSLLMSTLVSYAVINITNQTTAEVYRLDRPAVTRAEAERLIATIASINLDMEHGLDYAIRAEAGWVSQYVDTPEIVLANPFEEDVIADPAAAWIMRYPLTNLPVFRRDLHDLFSGFRKINRGDLWRQREAWDQWHKMQARELPWWEYVLRPGNVIWGIIGNPNFSGTISTRAETQSNLRLAILQIRLALFQAEMGRLPESLAELYGHAAMQPVINPLDGKEYPYPEFLVDDRVDSTFSHRSAKAWET